MYCKCNGASRITTNVIGTQFTTCTVCGRKKDPNPNQVYLDGYPVNVGDRLWSFSRGWLTVVDIDRFVDTKDSKGSTVCFLRSLIDPDHRTLFWDEVKFDIPEKPKPKVKKYKWVMKNKYSGTYWVTGGFYSEKDINSKQNRMTGSKPIEMVEETMIEV